MSIRRSFLARTAAAAGAALVALASLSACASNSTSTDNGQANQESAGGASDEAITPADVKALMDQGSEFVLLDVRTPEEYAEQHIEGAENLNYEDITADSAAEAITSTDTKVVLYCRSGHRAGIAKDMLKELGYTNVTSMGGISSWPYGYASN